MKRKRCIVCGKKIRIIIRQGGKFCSTRCEDNHRRIEEAIFGDPYAGLEDLTHQDKLNREFYGPDKMGYSE